MSATSIPYHLRPNKAIEREIFLDLLSNLSPVLPLSEYRYVGLGGPFLEDFRLIAKRVGLRHLTCVERDSETSKRQEFNNVSPHVELVCADLEDRLDDLSRDECSSIVWLDYSDSQELPSKLQSFAGLLRQCQPNSIIKMTLAAAPPGSWGSSPADRLDIATERFGSFVPTGLCPQDMQKTRYGAALLRAAELAISREQTPDSLKFVGLTSFLYADGVPMVTVTGALVQEDGVPEFLERTRITDWEFYNQAWIEPEIIDVPVLSLMEQKAIWMGEGVNYSLPDGRLNADAIENFKTYARVYPNYGRVDL